METEAGFIFLGSKITADGAAAMKLKMLAPWKKSYYKPWQHIQKQRHHLANKSLYSQNHGFSSGHVQMWDLDLNEGWMLKNWCFRNVVMKKTLESLLQQGDQASIS